MVISSYCLSWSVLPGFDSNEIKPLSTTGRTFTSELDTIAMVVGAGVAEGTAVGVMVTIGFIVDPDPVILSR